MSIAALLVVAKPFLGFATINKKGRSNQVHSILAKSFSKRKPESLQEADTKVNAIHLLLTNPLMAPLSAIASLLLILFPFIFKYSNKITRSLLSDIDPKLSPPVDVYLLTGKLLI